MSTLRSAIGRVGTRVAALAYRVHRLLLPEDEEIGWLPYLWLVYLFFIIYPLFAGDMAPSAKLATLVSVGGFLVLYFRAYWQCGREKYPYIAAIAALGVVLGPVNPGACTYMVYACAFAAFTGSPRRTLRIIAVIAAIAVAETWLLDLHVSFALVAVGVGGLVGLVNSYYRQLSLKKAELKLSQDEVKRLAATAERERIARDLHDVLGHTLSTVALKAELASRLTDRDTDRAGEEMAAVADIARETLAQVRAAVSGYRSIGVRAELANVRLLLEAAGVDFVCASEPPALDADTEHVLAMVLREAVTNIVRHAAASRCTIGFEQQGDTVAMRVADNGRARELTEGQGLRGMRERLAQVGGGLTITVDQGVSVTATVPAPVPSGTASRSTADRDARDWGVSTAPQSQ